MAKICNKCGSANEDSMRFCINCGNEFAQAQAQMPEQPKIKRPIYEQTDYAAIDARNAAKQQPLQQAQPPVMQNPMQAQPPVQQRPQPVQQMQYGQQMYTPAPQMQQPAPPKAPKKKNLTPIIVSIVAAVVVIGVALGVIFGIILPNKEKDKESKKEENATVETVDGTIEIQPTAKTIAAGMYNVFAVKKDGTVVATGNNTNGACDVGEWTDIVAVSSGGNYTLGLKSDGTVVSTEYKEEDDKAEYSNKCDVDDWTDIVSVVAAGAHSVGLKSDGTVVAVGDNLYGRCDVQDWKDIVAISASAVNTVGLKSDGTVVAIGDNTNGECDVEKWKDIIAVSSGIGITAGLKSDGTVVATGSDKNGACNVDGWNNIVAIATADDIIYGLKKDGTILSTRDGTADNDSDFIKISYMLGEIEKWKDIIAISTYGLGTEVIGLKADGTVVAVTITDYWCEEYDDDLDFEFDVSGWKDLQTTVPERFKTEVGKELVGGKEPSKPETAPGDVNNTYLKNNTYISACAYNSVALKSDGTVLAVGNDMNGQLAVDGWSDIISVVSGNEHTVGLKSDGTVVAVGSNTYGQCDVDSLTNIVAIAATSAHTVGLKSDGTVVVVGDNNSTEINVDGWSDIVAISAGAFHIVGLKSDGTVVATGWNENGQCETSGWSDIVAVAAGGNHTAGLKSDGTVVAAGSNDHGQCEVDGWSDIVAVAAGGNHTVGLKSKGTVVATKVILQHENEATFEAGQSNVGNWTDIVAVSAGGFHTVGLKSDGTAVAVGHNRFGQCDVGSWSGIKIPAQNGGANKPSKPSGTVDVTTPDAVKPEVAPDEEIFVEFSNSQKAVSNRIGGATVPNGMFTTRIGDFDGDGKKEMLAFTIEDNMNLVVELYVEENGKVVLSDQSEPFTVTGSPDYDKRCSAVMENGKLKIYNYSSLGGHPVYTESYILYRVEQGSLICEKYYVLSDTYRMNDGFYYRETISNTEFYDRESADKAAINDGLSPKAYFHEQYIKKPVEDIALSDEYVFLYMYDENYSQQHRLAF